MTPDFKVLPRLPAAAGLPEALLDEEFFFWDGTSLLYHHDISVPVASLTGKRKRAAACVQARLWSDYVRRHLGVQMQKTTDQPEKLQLHAEAVKARDTECAWIVWGWDATDWPQLAGREKFGGVPVNPAAGCC